MGCDIADGCVPSEAANDYDSSMGGVSGPLRGRDLLWIVAHRASPARTRRPSSAVAQAPQMALHSCRQNPHLLSSPNPENYCPQHGGYKSPKVKRGSPPSAADCWTSARQRPQSTPHSTGVSSSGSRTPKIYTPCPFLAVSAPLVDTANLELTKQDIQTPETPVSLDAEKPEKKQVWGRALWAKFADERKQQHKEREALLRNMRKIPFHDWCKEQKEKNNKAEEMQRKTQLPETDEFSLQKRYFASQFTAHLGLGTMFKGDQDENTILANHDTDRKTILTGGNHELARSSVVNISPKSVRSSVSTALPKSSGPDSPKSIRSSVASVTPKNGVTDSTTPSSQGRRTSSM